MIAPGIQELEFGSDRLNKIANKLSIPVVSANLPGFIPYILLSKNMGHTRVLITSVIDREFISNHMIKIQEVDDPVLSLHRIQQEIPHDLCVVIIHAPEKNLNSIVAQCPGIDLVVDGVSHALFRKSDGAGFPYIVANNEEGMYVSYIDYEGKSKAGPIFSKPLRIRASVGKIAEDAQIASIVNEYKQKRQTGFRKTPPKGMPLAALNLKEGSLYSGSESCSFCHSDKNDKWSGSRHATAMESLIRKSKQDDPGCLLCHVTGMESNASKSKHLWGSNEHPMPGVQCEACHGPGADHSRNPSEVQMLSVNEKTCTRCHTNYTDPGFDYKQDLMILNCNSREGNEG